MKSTATVCCGIVLSRSVKVKKRMISCVPTMRRASAVQCRKLLDAVNPSEKCIFVSRHPVDLMTEIESGNGIIVDSSFTSQYSVCFADVVITDYSGTSAEAVLAGKPLLFYVPDIQRYAAD